MHSVRIVTDRLLDPAPNASGCVKVRSECRIKKKNKNNKLCPLWADVLSTRNIIFLYNNNNNIKYIVTGSVKPTVACNLNRLDDPSF